MCMKRPLKIAAWSGILLVIVSFVVGIISAALTKFPLAQTIISIIWGLIGGVLTILFLNGFLVLGKKYKNSLLKVTSWIGIIMAVLFILVGLAGNIVSLSNGSYIQNNSKWPFGEGNDDALIGLVLSLIGVWIMFSLIFGAITILWGIGLMRLEKKVEHARVTGILNIIAGATYIILVGYIIGMVALVFEMVLMFKASKKLER